MGAAVRPRGRLYRSGQEHLLGKVLRLPRRQALAHAHAQLGDAVPDNGLIGCFSADEKTLMAIAFEPYQELFQGIVACIHSDFRIGGLAPGETKKIRGKIYILPANAEALLKRYHRDFPEAERRTRDANK